MKQIFIIVGAIILTILILNFATGGENFGPTRPEWGPPWAQELVPEWERGLCKLKCFLQGDKPAWSGEYDGAWNDPAVHSTATFDTAGCIRNCSNPGALLN